jgi:hypothetical protein
MNACSLRKAVPASMPLQDCVACPPSVFGSGLITFPVLRNAEVVTASTAASSNLPLLQQSHPLYAAAAAVP